MTIYWQTKTPNTTSFIGAVWHWTWAAKTQDNNGSYCDLNVFFGNDHTGQLLLTNYGFSIPADAVVVGVQAVSRRKYQIVRGTMDTPRDNLMILKSDLGGSDNKSTGILWGTSYADQSFGGITDLWGLALTPSVVNSSSFGVGVRGQIGPSTPGGVSPHVKFYVDVVTLTVYYQMPTVAAEEDTATVLRLLYGDKRNPTHTLDLTGSEVNMLAEGFNPGPGDERIVFTGAGPYHDGRERVLSSRDNAQFSLAYKITGQSQTDLGQIQRQIHRFGLACREYNERGKLQPVWLEYRFQDDLAGLPAPVFGQFSHYMRLLAIDIPEWPANLHLPYLQRGQALGVAAGFTCAPFSEGLPQTALSATSLVEQGHRGVRIGNDYTNLMTNPSFGHATWDAGWTAQSGLLAYQETRPDFCRSYTSAARLVNQSTSAPATFTQSLTLTTHTYIIACYVRRPDGTAVTSADVKMVGQGASLTTTFQPVEGGPWYRAYAQFTGAISLSTHGVEVQINRTVIIDDIQCQTAPTNSAPLMFLNGDKLGCTWSGTAHASTSSSSVPGELHTFLTDEMAGAFSVGGWLSHEWPAAGPASATYVPVFRYYVDANNYLEVTADATGFDVNLKVNSILTSTSIAHTWVWDEDIHLLVTGGQGETTYIYINGSLAGSISAVAQLPTGGSFGFDAGVSEAWMDGWRIWGTILTATQVSSLYSNESPVKARYRAIGMPPVWWTGNVSDDVLDTLYDSSYENFGVCLGIGGDVEPAVEWRIEPSTTPANHEYWLGRQAIEPDETLDPADGFYLEFSGTANASASGGQVESQTGTSLDFTVSLTDPLAIAKMRGRLLWLARVTTDAATAAATIQPLYALDSTNIEVAGDAVSVTLDTGLNLANLGELFLNWPFDAPDALIVGLRVTFASSDVARIDCIQLMPAPACRLSPVTTSATAKVSGDTIVLSGREAYLLNGSTYKNRFEHRGDELTLLPGKLNYVWLVIGTDGGAWTETDNATVTPIITPRYLLPGGPIA